MIWSAFIYIAIDFFAVGKIKKKNKLKNERTERRRRTFIESEKLLAFCTHPFCVVPRLVAKDLSAGCHFDAVVSREVNLSDSCLRRAGASRCLQVPLPPPYAYMECPWHNSFLFSTEEIIKKIEAICLRLEATYLKSISCKDASF